MKPDKKIILALNRPLGIIKRPFAPAAEGLGWNEDKLLRTIRSYKRKGLIRRLGLVLAHRKIGLKSNVMVAWNVPESRITRAVKAFGEAKEVSHCYQRESFPDWPYNLYTMVHTRNKRSSLLVISKLSRKCGVKDYRTLFTIKEFKKTKAGLWR